MVDIHSFSALRAPRRAEPEPQPDEVILHLAWTEDLPAVGDAGAVRIAWGAAPFLDRLRGIVVEARQQETRAELAEKAARAFLDTTAEAVGPAEAFPIDPSAGPDGAGQPFPGQAMLALWDRLDRWLARRRNRLSAAALDDELSDLQAEIFLGARPPQGAAPELRWLTDRRTYYARAQPAWDRLAASLAAALLSPLESDRAERLTRLVLVAGLVDFRSRSGAGLAPATTFDLLARRTPLLPSPPFPQVLRPHRVRLVRRVCVSDMFTVRQEWRCYVSGEIAEIRNVLAHETHSRKTVRVDEREVIDTTSREDTTSSQTSSESGEESSFSEQTRREIDLDLHAEAQVDVSGTNGVTTISASGGFSADFSLSEATERATQIARRATSRAASSVESKVRTERRQRVLTRLTDELRHKLSNQSSNHTRGVYRWVNRVDRLQIFRFPDRLQLEFQIPEPGRFLLSLMRERQDVPGSIPKPPDRVVLPPGGIDRGNYLAFGAEFGASELPEPPQDRLGVSASLFVSSKETPPDPLWKEQWNPPTLVERAEMAVPPNYAADQATASIHATPLLGSWKSEVLDPTGRVTDRWEVKERYHSILAGVAVGQVVFSFRETGLAAGAAAPGLATQSNGVAGGMPGFPQAALEATSTRAINPWVTQKVPVAASVVGASSAVVAVSLSCKLTDEAFERWKQEVYDAVRSAHALWLRDWRAQEARLGDDSSPGALAERGPARHQEMIRTEIRRHIVSWMLGESPFLGRPATREAPVLPPPPQPQPQPGPRPPPGAPAGGIDATPDIDIEKALETAPDIQFLEQCMEWTNLTWVAYPYFWADRERWRDLAGIETVDPALGSFLRAGSIRVVLPSRPGFERAVKHWLLYRQPWRSGAAPLPGQSTYVSVAQEIRDQTQPPRDGEPGESWEVELPTTLLWLDPEDAGLPHNPRARYGAAPNAPDPVLCPDDQTVPASGLPAPAPAPAREREFAGPPAGPSTRAAARRGRRGSEGDAA